MRRVLSLLFLLASCLAWAHDTSISGLKILLDKDSAIVSIQTAMSNLKKSSVAKDALPKELNLKINGRAWVCQDPQITVDEKADIVMLQAKVNFAIERLEVSRRLFANNPNSKTIVTVMKDGEAIGEGVLSSEFESWSFTVPQTKPQAPIEKVSPWATVKNFLLMGIQHILSGPDHLLFIFGLMLARPRVKELIKVATGFTVAHSITLSLCALNIFTLPSKIVEPLIALSIVAVAAEKFFKPNDKVWRTVAIAFCFGLIHGFGFAGALTEVGLPAGQAAISLASFNIGVEIVQISLIMVGIPILLWVQERKPKAYQPATIVCAVGISLAGLFWFGQRIISGG